MGCRLSGPWMVDVPGGNPHHLSNIREHQALRILASYEQPITVQIDGRRGRGSQYHRTSDSSTQTERPWDPRSAAPPSRPRHSHMALPGNHGNGSRQDYLPNAPRDLEDVRRVPRHDPELSSRVPQGQNCLMGCCNPNMDEPSSFHSQTEDEDYVLEKAVGYLPLHHELDSGLGWTDGSFHQGELSGVETEEGLDHQGGRGGRGGRGGSPSSESFVSSEPSDSGFYSVGTAELLRFQRLLEKRMRLYHQGELQSLCMEGGQAGHRELEAIPETLATQAEREPRPQGALWAWPGGAQRLNRLSLSSGAIFSACGSPCSQQRALTLHRSRTLHHRPAQGEIRRRASHPASPDHRTEAGHAPHRVNHPAAPHPANHRALIQPEIYVTHHTDPEAPPTHQPRPTHPSHATLPVQHTRPPVADRAARHGNATLPAQHTHQARRERLLHAASHPSLSSSADDHHVAPPRELYRPPGEGQTARERQTDARFHTLALAPSRGRDGNDTWPKPADRRGPYDTLQSPAPGPAPLNPRAQRNQLLRQRALRVADERGGGVSTDDEAHAETRRAGRYWSRSQRRQHVLQRHRLKRDAQVGGANTGAGPCEGGGYSVLMELSQRKLSRLRDRKLLDDWTTVEELLTHGTRLGIKDSLLTVTTV